MGLGWGDCRLGLPFSRHMLVPAVQVYTLSLLGSLLLAQVNTFPPETFPWVMHVSMLPPPPLQVSMLPL